MQPGMWRYTPTHAAHGQTQFQIGPVPKCLHQYDCINRALLKRRALEIFDILHAFEMRL